MQLLPLRLLLAVVASVAASSSGGSAVGGHGSTQYSAADFAAARASLPNGADLHFPATLDPFAVRDCRYRHRDEVKAERGESSLHRLCHRVCPRLAPQSDDIQCHEEVRPLKRRTDQAAEHHDRTFSHRPVPDTIVCFFVVSLTRSTIR